MSYILNPSAMSSVFMVPSDAVKSYIKLASAEQLRVLLCTMNNISNGINPSATADLLGIPLENVTDALNFWSDAGVFIRKTEDKPIEFEKPVKEKKTAKIEASKPSREEIAMMGNTDERVVFLLREAELKFRRPLRFTEMQSLVGLYADDGMDVSIILMLVEYAVSEDRANIGFINETARIWQSAGVDSLVAAEEQIEKRNRQKLAWSIVEKAFGIEHRMPSSKELEYSEVWVSDWKFDRAMLKEAYDICVDAKAKLSMPYINKILEGWHTKGFKTVEQTKAPTKKPQSTVRMASYDKEMMKKKLQSDD